MVDDFETKRAALEAIEDPHAKDLANYCFSLSNSAKRLGRAGIVAGGCYFACSSLLEGGDHILGSLCYAGCTLFTGAIWLTGADTLLSYTSFRKTWQRFSIPVKDFFLSFLE